MSNILTENEIKEIKEISKNKDEYNFYITFFSKLKKNNKIILIFYDENHNEKIQKYIKNIKKFFQTILTNSKYDDSILLFININKERIPDYISNIFNVFKDQNKINNNNEIPINIVLLELEEGIININNFFIGKLNKYAKQNLINFLQN